MKEKKKKILLFSVLACVLVLAIALLVFWNLRRRTVTWEVDENTSVELVKGRWSSTMKVQEGKTIRFKVNADQFYEVEAVLKGQDMISADDGVYEVTVDGDTTIYVNSAKAIESIEPELKDGISYYAGDMVSVDDLTVTAAYVDGTKEIVTDYVISYQTGAKYLALGDIGFTVSYKGTSATVEFERAVQGKVTLDPDGGVIDEQWLAAIRENKDVQNYSETDGIVSFVFDEISDSITLPAGEQIRRFGEEAWCFVSWKLDGQYQQVIPKGLGVSVSYQADYEEILVNLSRVELIKEDGKPYLTAQGTLNTSKEVYLMLQAESGEFLKSSAVSGKRGDSFVLKLQLDSLCTASVENGNLLAKPLRVKFCADSGDFRSEMSVDLDRQTKECVNISQSIQLDMSVYRFQAETDGAGRALLALTCVDLNQYEYTLSQRKTADGSIVLTIVGKVYNSGYYGKAVLIDVWCGNTVKAAGSIDHKGNFTVDLPFDKIPCGTDGFFHYTVIESVTDETVVYKDEECKGNLLNANCRNTDMQIISQGGIQNRKGIRLISGDKSSWYYVGFGYDKGLMLWGYEPISAKKLGLEIKNNAPYLVLSGEFQAPLTRKTAKSRLEEKYKVILLQCLRDWNYPNNDAQGNRRTQKVTVETYGDGSYKVYIDLPVDNLIPGDRVYGHTTLEAKDDNWTFTGEMDRTTVKIGDYTYGLIELQETGCGFGWNMPCVTVTGPEFMFTGAALVEKNGKAMLKIDGTYQHCDTIEKFYEIFAAASHDFQNASNYKYFVGEDKILEAANGSFSVYLDLTNLPAGDWMTHYNGNLSLEKAEHGSSIRVGNKTYTIKNYHNGQWNLENFYRMVTIEVQDFREYEFTGAELAVVGGQPMLKLTGTYARYGSDEEFAYAFRYVFDMYFQNIAGWQTPGSNNSLASVMASQGVFVAQIDISNLTAGAEWFCKYQHDRLILPEDTTDSTITWNKVVYTMKRKGTYVGLTIIAEEVDPLVERSVSLTVQNEKPYIAVEGTYEEPLTQETARERLEQQYKVIVLQSLKDWRYPNDDSENKRQSQNINIETREDGSFTVLIDLPEDKLVNGDVLYGHTTLATSGDNWKVKGIIEKNTVMAGDYIYTMGELSDEGQSWGMNMPCVKVAENNNGSFRFAEAEMVLEEGQPMFRLTGTYEGYSSDASFVRAMQKAEFGFQNYMASGWPWVEGTRVDKVTAAGGTFAAYLNVSHLNVGGKYLMKYNRDDFKLEGARDDSVVTANNIRYRLENNSGKHWGVVTVVVEDVEPIVEEVADITLVEGAPYITVSGTFDKALSQEEAQAKLEEKYQVLVLQSTKDWRYPNDKNGERRSQSITVETKEDGSFIVRVDLPMDKLVPGDILYGHTTLAASGDNWVFGGEIRNTAVSVGEMTYTILDLAEAGVSWGKGMPGVKVSQKTRIELPGTPDFELASFVYSGVAEAGEAYIDGKRNSGFVFDPENKRYMAAENALKDVALGQEHELIIETEDKIYIQKFWMVTMVIDNLEEFKQIQTKYFQGTYEGHKYTFTDANKTAQYRDGYFVLGSDINADGDRFEFTMSPVGFGKDGHGLASMGNNYDEAVSWYGVIDGRGHSVYNIDTGYGGVFGRLPAGSVIKNISFIGGKTITTGKTLWSNGTWETSGKTYADMIAGRSDKGANTGFLTRGLNGGTVENVTIEMAEMPALTRYGVLAFATQNGSVVKDVEINIKACAAGAVGDRHATVGVNWGISCTNVTVRGQVRNAWDQSVNEKPALGRSKMDGVIYTGAGTESETHVRAVSAVSGNLYRRLLQSRKIQQFIK